MKRATLLASAGTVVLVALVVYLGISRPVRAVQELSQAEFLAKFQSNLIGQLQISYPPEPPLFVQRLRGTFYETDSAGQFLLEKGTRKEVRFQASFHIPDDLDHQLMTNSNYSIVTLNPAVQKVKDWFSRGR